MLIRRLRVLIALGLIVLLIVGLKVWSWAMTGTDPNRLVTVHKLDVAEGASTLIVLVHGAGGPSTLEQVRDHLAHIEADSSRLEAQGINTANLDEKPPALGLQMLAENPTRAHVLTLNYGSSFWVQACNSDPKNIALGVSRRIQETCDRFEKTAPIARIVLVGHSQGALIARKAFVLARATPDLIGDDDPALVAEAEPAAWATRTFRLVLLAGMNRGWDISGHKPADMSTLVYLQLWTMAWVADLTGTGGLGLAMESGAPFVANLRLQWMRLSRKLDQIEVDQHGEVNARGDPAKKRYRKDLQSEMPAAVQLQGDIDDVVSADDNMDLRATGSPNFTWVKVRGTGHSDIRVFDPRTFDPAHPYVIDPVTKDEPGRALDDLGSYRRVKFHRAVTEPFYELQRENEEQPVRVDRRVRRIVFVVHGIRDLGRWSAEFERALLARWRQQHPEDGSDESGDKLAIVSPRYGYFGMGPFLVRPDRQRYVRWLMDEYTEARARYPEATTIDFVCHSNGTYLLASALDQYHDMHVNRVVFGGSVVRHEYDWGKILARGQVKAVRNYVAKDDLVVGLFPTFFEQYPMRLFGNDLGSAGFNGFQHAGNNVPVPDDSHFKPVENVGPLTGGHAALLQPERVQDVVQFLLPDLAPAPTPATPWNKTDRDWYLDWASVGCIVIWGFLATILVLGGFWLTRGARQFALVVAILYIVGLWWLLNAV